MTSLVTPSWLYTVSVLKSWIHSWEDKISKHQSYLDKIRTELQYWQNTIFLPFPSPRLPNRVRALKVFYRFLLVNHFTSPEYYQNKSIYKMWNLGSWWKLNIKKVLKRLLKSKPMGQETCINLSINYYVKVTWQRKPIYI